ncbi:hypothetical protein ACFWZU_16190 [Frateuria sp. GZRR33]|uniref:AbiU2 domain-containing protein n=1 Tax=Frateuria sp. GZRR33 TaxID=3351535 RepID=UPI003EDB9863
MSTPQEKDFLDALTSSREDINHAKHYFLIHFAFYRTLGESRDVQEKLRDHQRYWNFVLNGLTGGLIISLGRVYDSGGKTLTWLLDHAIKNEEIFKRGVDSVYLSSLKAEFLDYRETFYNKALQTLRSKVVAHTVITSKHQVTKVFKDLQEGEVHTLIAFAHKVHEALYNLFHEGKLTKLPLELPQYPTLWFLDEIKPWQNPGLDEWGLCDQVNSFLMSQLRIPA